MADGRRAHPGHFGKSALLVPVLIDDLNEAAADVPEAFRHVHWTRLPGGETDAAAMCRAHGWPEWARILETGRV